MWPSVTDLFGNPSSGHAYARPRVTDVPALPRRARGIPGAVRGHSERMGVDVRPRVLVRRPRAEVAAYMFDPAHDLAWTGGIIESRPLTPGPLREGSVVERSARFLGRSFTYRFHVTAHEPDRSVQMRVDRPFPMTIRYELADASGDTLVTIHAAGEPGRFFRWATPVLARRVRSSITADLNRLRDRLEAGDRPAAR